MKNMWMVRAGEDAFLIEDFKKKDYVSIGWNELSLLAEQLKQLVKKEVSE